MNVGNEYISLHKQIGSTSRERVDELVKSHSQFASCVTY